MIHSRLRAFWRDLTPITRIVLIAAVAVLFKMTNSERNNWAKAGYPVEPLQFSVYANAAIRRIHYGWGRKVDLPKCLRPGS